MFAVSKIIFIKQFFIKSKNFLCTYIISVLYDGAKNSNFKINYIFIVDSCKRSISFNYIKPYSI